MRRRLPTAASSFHRHALLQMAVDGVLVALSVLLAYRLRFDADMPPRYRDLRDATIGWSVLITLATCFCFGLYAKRWRYTGQRDYMRVVQALLIATLLLGTFVNALNAVTVDSPIGGSLSVSIPTGVLGSYFLVMLLLLGGVRFVVHAVYEKPLRGFRARRDAKRLLIVGAGDGGRLVLREVLRNPELGLNPIGFVDDDPLKRGTRIDGVRVVGDAGADLPRILDELQPGEVTIAVPSAPGTLRAHVVRCCRERGIPVRTLPTVFELLQGGANVVRQVREVQVEDVLNREPVLMDVDRVGRYLEGRVVMVTGAGGSIGSELCRQIARVAPRRLVLVDHAEDNLFAIQRELEEDRHVHPSSLLTVLADCKDGERMREVFADSRPTVVFHAAAYKHVGLMELNPVEAVRNNALATRQMCRISGEAGVERFLLVSTDKAVEPATVMGASKALAEFAVEEATQRWPGTRYAAVRFGNVLGSSGSVVPIFRRQIARGGPITVTDERMQRYFMTIPEAVQLILRAGSLGKGTGEVFVLDMGEPVKIIDLARAMIELSGLTERDVPIQIVGRRPGEKLDETLFNAYERVVPTPAEKISQAEREALDPETVAEMFDAIGLLVLEGDAAGLAAKVAALSSFRTAPTLAPPA